MAVKQINEFPQASKPLADGDIVHAKQGASDKKLSVADIKGEIASVSNYYTCSGTVNTYTLTAAGKTIAPSEYFDGFEVVFKPNITNTSQSTINVDGLGARSVYNDGAGVVANDLLQDEFVCVIYDSTLNVFHIKEGSARYVDTTNNQNISGNKTFKAPIVVEGGVTSEQNNNLKASATGNANYFLRDDLNNPQGVLFWNRGDDTVRLSRYADDNSTLDAQFIFRNDGGINIQTRNNSGSVYCYSQNYSVGENKTTRGILTLYGDGAGSAEGGRIAIQTPADYDSVVNNWTIYSWQDTFRITNNVGNIALTLSNGETIPVAEQNTTISGEWSFTHANGLNLPSSGPRITFDNTLASDGYGNKRITCNDGAGNFNIRTGGYVSGGQVLSTTAGHGAAQTVYNFEAVDGYIEHKVAPVSVNADDVVSWTNGLSIGVSGGVRILENGVWNTVWHQGNDGPGSQLNADLIDSYHAWSSGNNWGVVPIVTSGGVAEMGFAVDFHNTDTATTDYDVRLSTELSSTDLYINGNKIWRDGAKNGVAAATGYTRMGAGMYRATNVPAYTDLAYQTDTLIFGPNGIEISGLIIQVQLHMTFENYTGPLETRAEFTLDSGGMVAQVTAKQTYNDDPYVEQEIIIPTENNRVHVQWVYATTLNNSVARYRVVGYTI